MDNRADSEDEHVHVSLAGIDHLNRNGEIVKKVPPLGNGKSARVSRQDKNLKTCGTREAATGFCSVGFRAGAYRSPDADVRCTSYSPGARSRASGRTNVPAKNLGLGKEVSMHQSASVWRS